MNNSNMLSGNDDKNGELNVLLNNIYEKVSPEKAQTKPTLNPNANEFKMSILKPDFTTKL